VASDDLGRILRNPGRLCVSPTSLSAAFPHGGTNLGLVRGVSLRPQQVEWVVTAEEWGEETVEVIDGGRSWVIAVALRGWDPDAVQAVLPSSTLGTSGTPLASHPGSARAGALRSAAAVKLLFSPDAPAQQPAALFHRAIPLVEASAELTLALAEEGTLGVVFRAIRRASDGLAFQFGALEDLTL
jgi:hypothetical protein